MLQKKIQKLNLPRFVCVNQVKYSVGFIWAHLNLLQQTYSQLQPQKNHQYKTNQLHWQAIQMTLSAKSHAREKPVLTGYEGKKKKKVWCSHKYSCYPFCSDYLFFTFFIFPLANENERTIITWIYFAVWNIINIKHSTVDVFFILVWLQKLKIIIINLVS